MGLKSLFTMNDDLQKYPRFFFDELTRTILPEEVMLERNPIIFRNYQRHHFVEKTIRKTNPAEYARFEYLQKMIFLPAEMNYDLSSGMGEERFLEKWGINKFDAVFNKDKWLENYYEK